MCQIGAHAEGMRFREIKFENIGPIRQAAIGRHRLCVFVGPNNSGKSIASRIMYGACQLDPSSGVQLRLIAGGRFQGEQCEEAARAARSVALVRCAGIRRDDIVSYSADSGRLVLTDDGKTDTTMVFNRGDGPSRRSFAASLLGTHLEDAAKNSIYVPAGRTGTVQSLLAIMQIKSDLLNSVLRSLGERPSAARSNRSGSITPRLRRQMPEYLEQFYNIVLEAFSGGLGEEGMDMFSRVFEGSIKASAADELPAIFYYDPSDFAVEIDSAGSGVVSAFPIAATMYRIEPGGMLIIEEPEAHMEPLRQLRLVNEIVRAALKRDVSLVLTTHSDFVVHAVLDMVRDRIVDSSDLGLYYFRRNRGSYTDVERVHVNSAGEAEMELFDAAVDALAYGSVMPDAP